ncbi:hypothetical protein ACB094_11G115300 [Castanea mollissima]
MRLKKYVYLNYLFSSPLTHSENGRTRTCHENVLVVANPANTNALILK